MNMLGENILVKEAPVKDFKQDGIVVSRDDDDTYMFVEILSINENTFKNCLEIIQQLEPSGVGARNLSECLIIQIRNLGIKNELLEIIVSKDLHLIGKNKYKEVCKKYNISMQKCLNTINIIKKLNKKQRKIYYD